VFNNLIPLNAKYRKIPVIIGWYLLALSLGINVYISLIQLGVF
jgi:hypothetical protein